MNFSDLIIAFKIFVYTRLSANIHQRASKNLKFNKTIYISDRSIKPIDLLWPLAEVYNFVIEYSKRIFSISSYVYPKFQR